MDEVRKPKTLLERLEPWQPWQPSIAALLGFTGVILAMLYNGHKDRAIKAEEEFRAAQATAYGIYLDMERIDDALRIGEYGAYYVQNEMVERKSERFDLCMRNFEVQRERKIETLGVFEAVRVNLGRLPPEIMNHYLVALSRVDDLKRATSATPTEQKISCERTPIGEVGSARYAYASAVHAIGKLADAIVLQYPELRQIAEQRRAKPEHVPLLVRMANDRRIEEVRREESKAAIAKAEAEEAADAQMITEK